MKMTKWKEAEQETETELEEEEEAGKKVEEISMKKQISRQQRK